MDERPNIWNENRRKWRVDEEEREAVDYEQDQDREVEEIQPVTRQLVERTSPVTQLTASLARVEGQNDLLREERNRLLNERDTLQRQLVEAERRAATAESRLAALREVQEERAGETVRTEIVDHPYPVIQSDEGRSGWVLFFLFLLFIAVVALIVWLGFLLGWWQQLYPAFA